ncbi:hypothetical protein ACWGB8_25660 [Kitasatospora sp. NPDC054939]
MSDVTPGGRPLWVLAGFALLLVVVFGVAFAVGRAAGPVAPGVVPWGGDGATPGGGHVMGLGAVR